MKKGFTLIELLAVIVILAIIALIATPIVLNIINNAKNESEERSIELYASAVKNAIAAYQLKGTSAPTDFSQLTVEYDGDVQCETKELYQDGSFYLAGCKVNKGTKEYTYGKEQESSVAKWTLISDADSSGTITTGDMITYTFGEETENFYVISNDGTNIEMLTEYNLSLTSPYLQDKTGTINPIAFSNTNYWSSGGYSSLGDSSFEYVYDSNSLIYPIVEGYVSHLNSNGVSGVTGKLLSVEQADALGCDTNNHTCYFSTNKPWVATPAYWTGSAYSGGSNYVWHVLYAGYSEGSNDFGGGTYDLGNYYGVRPVITVPKAQIG